MGVGAGEDSKVPRGGRLASTRTSLPARETQVWAEEQVRKIKRENEKGWAALVCGPDPSALRSECGSGGGDFRNPLFAFRVRAPVSGALGHLPRGTS